MDQAEALSNNGQSGHQRMRSVTDSDPFIPNILITLGFLSIASVRLTVPEAPYFDEVHYVPAARDLLAGEAYRNQEHPLFGKQLIALGTAIFGDNPLGWRLMPLMAGTLALFASMRAMWFASQSRFASIAFGLLLASGFALFVQSRIAMLDIFMMSGLSVAAWQFAAAIHAPEKARKRLVITGIALGLAMASKWNAVPLAILPALAFFIARLSAHRRRPIVSARGLPIPGISMWEAMIWLGALPLIVYMFTFLPVWTIGNSPLASTGLIGLHVHMIELQTQVLKSHPYQSSLADWIINWRAIWYLYEPIGGAQRGIMLIGNPLTMLLGIPALLWCFISGIRDIDWTRLAVLIGYLVSIGLWLLADKPVQFYYHYFVPSCFLLASLALTLDAMWRSGKRLASGSLIAVSLALFAWFYPILSAAPLDNPDSFRNWTWLASWT